METFNYIGQQSGIDYNHITKIVNLMYFEGPLLAYYVGNNGENYLLYWIDNDDKYNRWLVFTTEVESVYRYISGKTSLLNLLKKYSNDQIAVVDIDNEINFHERGIIRRNTLKSSYLPSKDSYFDILDVDCSPYREDRAICRLSTAGGRKRVKTPTYQV